MPQRFSQLFAFAMIVMPTASWGAGTRDPVAADAMFRSGRDAMAQGDAATACARFQESYRLDPAAGTLLNLSECEEKRNRLATARQHLIEAMETLPAGDMRMSYAQQRLKRLDDRVPHVVFTLQAADARDVRVLRDGVELGAASVGVPLPLDPGKHVLVVRATGRVDAQYDFSIAEGETKELSIALGRVIGAIAQPPSDASGPAEKGPPPSLVYTTLGVGAVGLTLGTIAGVLTIRDASTVRTHCKGSECDAEGMDAASRGRTMCVVSPIGFAIAAAGTGLGIYLVASSPKGAQARGVQTLRVGAVESGLGVVLRQPF